MNRFSRPVYRVLPLILVLFALIPLAVPYLQDGYQIAHDRMVPYMRVWSLREAIITGQLPPRWFPDFDGGYGSPYPSFYGMLFYYAAAAISVPGIQIGAAVEIAAFLTLAFSAIWMYFFVKQLWGVPSGILAAVGYSYAPYHLVDAFVRGAYSELTAFVWFPLILSGFLGWVKTMQRGWLGLATVSMTGLLLTHNLMPILFLPFALIFPLLYMWDLHLPRDGIKRRLIGLAWSGILTFLMVAYFWIPILLERASVRLDYFMEFDYRSGFVSLAELFSTASKHSLTKEAGILLLIGMLVASLLVIFDKKFQFKATLIGASVASMICLYMTTQSSAWFWNLLPFLSFTQFPWRFLSPAVFFLAIPVGALPLFLSDTKLKWAIVVGLSFVMIDLAQPLLNIPDRADSVSLNSQIVCQEVWGTQDYRPSWSKTRFWSSPNPPSLPGDPLVLPPCQGELTPTSNEAVTFQSVQRLGARWDINLIAARNVGLIVPQFYYPGWQAWLDDQATPLEPFGDNGLIRVSLPSGQHHLQIALTETPIRNTANLLTITGLILTAATLGKADTFRWQSKKKCE